MALDRKQNREMKRSFSPPKAPGTAPRPGNKVVRVPRGNKQQGFNRFYKTLERAFSDDPQFARKFESGQVFNLKGISADELRRMGAPEGATQIRKAGNSFEFFIPGAPITGSGFGGIPNQKRRTLLTPIEPLDEDNTILGI